MISYSRSAASARTGWRFSHQISVTSTPGARRIACERELKKLLDDLPFRFASIDSVKGMRGPEGFRATEDFLAHTRMHADEEGETRYLDRIMEMYAEQNYVIGFGRLVHISMPHAFHVLLTCDEEDRVRRLALDRKISEGLVKMRLHREEQESKALCERLYPGSSWPASDFDCVVSTTEHAPKAAAKLILDRHAEWLKRQDPAFVARGVKHLYAPVLQAI